MLRGTRSVLGLLAALVLIPAQAAETRNEEFGDWGFICNTPDKQQEDVRESCNLFQTALMNGQQDGEKAEGAQQQRVLLTRVGYLQDIEHPVLLITAPLGILLPMGINVEVEGHDPIRIPLQRCDAGGCLGFVAMEGPFIDAMKKGSEAKVTFYDAQRRGVTIPLSLKGFTRGIQALDKTRNP